jgi:two-component system alkaline phosphatase synthesis response regulator PhoP
MSNRALGRPILVVDDDAKIVRLVRTYLEREGYPVVTARDGVTTLELIQSQNPRLVVLDLMLPGLDGRAVIRAVRDQSSAVPILVLTARGGLVDRLGGLEDGADDYLPKPFSPSELVLRVKAILRRTEGNGHSDDPVEEPLAHADLTLDRERHEIRRAGIKVDLTRIEFRLLQVLLEADGRVLTRNQLLDAVYGSDATDILDRTIDVHVRRLREKLGDDPDTPRYVATIRGIGYRAAPAGQSVPGIAS